MTHHPHVHCVVPGGGLSSDGTRWVAARPSFFLAIFRRLFLERLQAGFDARMLGFYTNLTHLADRDAFAAHVQAMRRIDWVVYAKKPFGGPAQVLAYLGRYTHRVAIANSRIKALDDDHVAFNWKDYRQNGAEKIMLKPDEFSEQSNMSRLMRQSPAPPSCAKLASLTGSSRLPNSPPWQ